MADYKRDMQRIQRENFIAEELQSKVNYEKEGEYYKRLFTESLKEAAYQEETKLELDNYNCSINELRRIIQKKALHIFREKIKNDPDRMKESNFWVESSYEKERGYNIIISSSYCIMNYPNPENLIIPTLGSLQWEIVVPFNTLKTIETKWILKQQDDLDWEVIIEAVHEREKNL